MGLFLLAGLSPVGLSPVGLFPVGLFPVGPFLLAVLCLEVPFPAVLFLLAVLYLAVLYLAVLSAVLDPWEGVLCLAVLFLVVALFPAGLFLSAGLFLVVLCPLGARSGGPRPPLGGGPLGGPPRGGGPLGGPPRGGGPLGGPPLGGGPLGGPPLGGGPLGGPRGGGSSSTPWWRSSSSWSSTRGCSIAAWRRSSVSETTFDDCIGVNETTYGHDLLVLKNRSKKLLASGGKRVSCVHKVYLRPLPRGGAVLNILVVRKLVVGARKFLFKSVSTHTSSTSSSCNGYKCMLEMSCT